MNQLLTSLRVMQTVSYYVMTFNDRVLLLTLSHARSGDGLLGATKAQLPADDAGRRQVPAIVAHCAPLVVLQHLHATLAQLGSSLQPHVVLDKKTNKNTQKNYILIYCTCGRNLQLSDQVIRLWANK